MSNPQNSMDKALLALSQKKAAQKEQEKQMNQKPPVTGMDIMNGKRGIINANQKATEPTPTPPDVASIKDIVHTAMNVSPIPPSFPHDQENRSASTFPTASPRKPSARFDELPSLNLLNPENRAEVLTTPPLPEVNEVNHEDLAKIAEEALREKHRTKRPRVAVQPTGRSKAVQTQALQNASRIEKPCTTNQTTTIKNVPKGLLHLIELELKSAGLHELNQTDTVVGWIASRFDAMSLKMIATELTDTQLQVVKALHHRALSSDTEKLDQIQNQLQALDKKMDTLRLFDAYTFMDRAGWMDHHAVNPSHIEFDYSGPVGDIADVIQRADESVLKLRMDLQRKTGRPLE